MQILNGENYMNQFQEFKVSIFQLVKKFDLAIMQI